jgi:predicted ATPase/DNA-binding SARP family transcriptional activator
VLAFTRSRIFARPYARAVLQIAVLGPLEVTRDGASVPVPRGRTSDLLVRLALEAGSVVSAERLVDDLWGAVAAETRRNTLQSKIAMMRRALGPSAVVSRDSGYALAVEPSQVDALVALRHADEAVRLRAAGDAVAAADLAASTLALFRGAGLEALSDAEWADVHRTRIHEAHGILLEIQLWARLQLGDVVGVVGELEAAVAAFPYRESLWELLITALYRAGRQHDALATYQRVKRTLADELGLDPGPQLQRLEQKVLAQELPVGRPADTAADLPRGNLPSMSAGLVGRETEVATLAELLTRERLVEVVGPGGIGKTAVVLEAGRHLKPPGGVWLARLETAVTASDVVDVVVAAFNGPGGESALYERLKGTSAVVILDNCEHVVEAASALAVRLLDHAPGLRVLCTSQVPLEIDGEHVVELAPLAHSDAVELFTRRAQRLTESAYAEESVANLCRSLDGLPLAIELAAARTRTLTVEEITRRLDDRFTVLNDPTSRRPERRRSLRSTIQWSYELLFPDDKRGLWALATFAGGAPLPAVEFVLESLGVPATAAIDVVDRLVTRSLITVDGPDERDGPASGTRYRLLDSIRAFALESMREAGLEQAGRAAHASWFADAARASTDGVRSGRQAEFLAIARAERANIDVALAWSTAHDPLQALELANGFGWAWVVLGDSRGAERILTALAAVGDGGPARDRAGALLLAGWIEASSGHLEPARRHVDAATEIAMELDDDELRARCAYYLAYVVSHHGEFAEALELTDRSRTLYDALDRPWDQAANALFAARAAISAGDQGRSVETVRRAQDWLQSVDDPWLRVRGEALVGELARIQRRFDDAVVHLRSAAEASGRLGFLQTEAYQLSSLGRAQCQAGDYASGAATLVTAIDKAEATGDVRLAALARVHLGRVLRAEGHLGRARAALEAAAAWHRESGGGEQAALGECLLAALDAADHVPSAHGRLVAILADARRDDAAHVEVFALDALGRLAADAGDPSTARGLWAEADRRMDTASHFITAHDRTDAHWVRQPV